MGESIAQQIVLIKEKSAVDVFEYVKSHSEVAEVLNEPCSRWNNYKAKMIVSVESAESARMLVEGVNAIAADASKEILNLLQSTLEKSVIHYHSSVVQLMDPDVRLSVRHAETVIKTPLNKVVEALESTITKSGTDDGTTQLFIRKLNEGYDAGRIDLSSSEIVRLSRSSGRSCRVQALAADHEYAVQLNVRDLLVFVYEHPEEVRVMRAPKRKTRADKAELDVIDRFGTWTLARYVNK
jgi:hypothetical protein